MVSRVDTVNLSNMPVISEEVSTDGMQITYHCISHSIDLAPSFSEHEDGSWKVTKFEKTPLVSNITQLQETPFTKIGFELFDRFRKRTFRVQGEYLL